MPIPNTSKLAGHGEYLPESLWEGNINMADCGRRPYVPVGYTAILEEPGRRLAGPFGPENRTAFNYTIARKDLGEVLMIFVKTGSGQVEARLHDSEAMLSVLLAMTSDQRFALLHGIAQAHIAGFVEGEAAIQNAFLEGRLKKVVTRGLAHALVEPAKVDA